MLIPKSAATKALSTLVAVVLVVSVVAVGGVAQTESENSGASTEDAEPNDSMENATPIEYGAEIDANLSSPDDVDYYAVNATAGDGILPRVHLESMFAGGAVSVDVISPDGEVTTEITNDLINGPQNNAGPASFSADDTAYTGDVMESNGTYYVRVREPDHLPVGSPQTNESDTYRYSLTVNRTDLDEYDPNENGANATSLELGTALDATATGYDNDVYAVDLTAGTNYTVNVEADSWLEKSVAVFDDPSQATDADDYWNDNATAGTDLFIEDATVTFTAPDDGTYYIELSESGTNPSLLDRSNYTITVSESESPSVEDPLPGDGDADSDGLTNAQESDHGTDPRDADTDGDGLSDGREVNDLGTDPTSSDTDDDGLDDDCELEYDTDPTDSDTDGDGTPDGQEV